MWRKKRKLEDKAFDSLNNLNMVVLLLVTGYPLLYLLFRSLSGDLLGNELLFYPKGLSFKYYLVVFTDNTILQAAFISASRTLIGPLLMLFVTTMAGYVMTEKKLVFYKFFWRFFLITMFVNGGLIPTYLLMRSIGLYSNFWVYIIPGIFGGAFFMILIKTYIGELPADLKDAARIDGANDVFIFFKIILPLIKPILATIGLFSAVGHWNSWVDTMLYNAERIDLHTLQYSLMMLINKYGDNVSIERIRELEKLGLLNITPAGLKAALTFVTIIPILCVYPFLQKHFTKGLLIGAIKA